MDLDSLLKDIASGVSVKSTELLPYLCLESAEQRCQVNVKLAEAYAEIQNFEQAKVFVQRAWLLSEFSEDLLPLYLKVHAALDDIASIQAAYKRLGMKKAAENNIAEAIEYFRLSMYAYSQYQNLDHYDYDFDILERIEKLAEPYQSKPGFQPGALSSRKIRLAYLVLHITSVGSVLVKINCLFAQFHDQTRFEVAFFVPEPKWLLFDSGQARENVKIFRDDNCHIVVPTSTDATERLLEVATQIYNYQPDILITSALLPDHYFIASLHPAPVVISLVAGPPPQFVSPGVDWSITYSKHPLIDCPCDCSLVDLEVDLPERDSITFYTKQQLDLPEESFILVSGGRGKKFQEPDFWRAILDIMRLYPNVYYVAIGIGKAPPFLEELLAPRLKTRLRLLGWRGDYLEILGLADIVIDTFPSGGGIVLMDAMALGIPVVSFRNNYMRLFDQTDWSPAEEIIEIPDLIVERGNFEQFKLVVSKLIDDREYRLKMAKLCKEQIGLKHDNPERMVRRCESIYVKVLENKLQQDRFPVLNNKPVLDDIGEIEYFKMSLSSGLQRIPRRIRRKLINYARTCYRRLPLNHREAIRKYYAGFKRVMR